MCEHGEWTFHGGKGSGGSVHVLQLHEWTARFLCLSSGLSVFSLFVLEKIKRCNTLNISLPFYVSMTEINDSPTILEPCIAYKLPLGGSGWHKVVKLTSIKR